MSAPRSVGAMVRRLTRQAVGGKAAALGALMADWRAVAVDGPALAARPMDIAFPRGKGEGGVLTLACDPADALVLQHDLDRIRDRVNRFFGHAAIARIKLVQTPIAPPKTDPPPRRTLDRTDEAEIETLLAKVDDAELRDRLRQYAERLWTRPDGA